MSLPLEGIKVCDLSQIMFGPCGTQALGDFGADVVKIEKPGSGDITRSIDRFAAPGAESANFMGMNRNKRSIAVDMKTTEGVEIVRTIAGQSDVFVHNFRPGVIERLGLGYDDVRAAKPDIIYVEGSGFGSTGPLRKKGGMDFVAQALAGIANGNRDPDGRPQLFPVSAADFSAGMILSQSVLLALFHRERTGLGQKVEINLFDVYLVMQQQEVTQKLLSGNDFNPLRQDPMDIFETKDGYIAVLAVLRPNPVSDICRALEIPDVTNSPELGSLERQMTNRKLYRAKLGEGFIKFTTVECERRLEEAGILSSGVLSLDEALEHAQTKANGILIELEHPKHGPIKTVGNAIKSSVISQIPLVPPPLLGQHTDEILAQYGYSREQISELAQKQVVAPAGVGTNTTVGTTQPAKATVQAQR